MFIEQPPRLYRWLFPQAMWRKPNPEHPCVYLTFDDGPIPEVTPWVLDLLDSYQIKATFFCVGDNVAKHPDVYQEVLAKGHRVGNHTMNHIQALHYSRQAYIENVSIADGYIASELFRPPHGHMPRGLAKEIAKTHRIVMWDVVTRDYSKRLEGEAVLANVKRYTRNGSILVFHDSLKAERNLKYALPKAIEWLIENGYSFELL